VLVANAGDKSAPKRGGVRVKVNMSATITATIAITGGEPKGGYRAADKGGVMVQILYSFPHHHLNHESALV